jgi:capsular polysaccharide biosynthesis protein
MVGGARGLLRRRQGILALATLVVVVAGTLVAAFVPKDRYEATAVVSVEPGDPNVNTQLVNFLIPTVEARIEGQSLAAEVASRLPADLAQAGWTVRTSVEPGSGVLRITVSSDDRDVPLTTANAYAQTLDERIPGTQVLDAVVIDPASRTVVVSSRPTILISGLSLALILSVLVGFGLRAPAEAGRSVRGPVNGSEDHLVAGPMLPNVHQRQPEALQSRR